MLPLFHSPYSTNRLIFSANNRSLLLFLPIPHPNIPASIISILPTALFLARTHCLFLVLCIVFLCSPYQPFNSSLHTFYVLQIYLASCTAILYRFIQIFFRYLDVYYVCIRDYQFISKNLVFCYAEYLRGCIILSKKKIVMDPFLHDVS